MTLILNWHAKFNVYSLKTDDILLISELDCLALPAEQFSAFNYFDGVLSVDQITAKLQEKKQDVATFLYQLESFKKQQLLVPHNSVEAITFVSHYCSKVNATINQDHYSLVDLTANQSDYLTPWLALFDSITIPPELQLTFILCDDLLNPALLDLVVIDQPVCLIKSCGEQISFTPIIKSLDSRDYVYKLQQRLKHNNPTLAMLETIDANANLMLPYQANEILSEGVTRVLKTQLNTLLRVNEAQLTIINRHSKKIEKHPISLLAKGESDFGVQVLSAINLQSCMANFNKDGGSRTILPQETVDSLQPFISPKTGLITHIVALTECAENPVKIYTTAFFKKPAVTNFFKLNNNSFVHSCMGKGVSHAQSQASALCEAVERFSAHYQGDEPLFLNKPNQLSGRYYDFQQLVPYTDKQYQQFNDVNHPDSTLKQAAVLYQGQAVHWLPTWSLTYDEHVYLPLTHCFANLPFEDEHYARWHSNGCAAGNTLEEAILQALFELIERDAVAIWWYNRIVRPAYDLMQIEAENLALLDETLALDHDYWVLDLTHDIGIPVMVAVGQHKQTKGLSFGFGCHLQSELAAQRALTELCQLIPIRNQKNAPFDFDAVQQAPFLFPANIPQSKDCNVVTHGDLKLDIEAIIEKLHRLQLETLVINYSRKPLPIKAAKVFVPGLCHIWPQLDNKRLYQTPVKLGWLDKPYCEETINQHALYV